MIERVARAMRLQIEMERLGIIALDGCPPDGRAEIEARTEAKWRSEIPLARAAIEAMREPTEEMVGAGREVIRRHFNDVVSYAEACTEAAAETHTAMIDAALAPHAANPAKQAAC